MSTENEPGPPLNTFIVRFWREPGAGRPYWRGQAQHVQSGERAAFTNEATLMSFIQRWVQTPERSQELREEGSRP